MQNPALSATLTETEISFTGVPGEPVKRRETPQLSALLKDAVTRSAPIQPRAACAPLSEYLLDRRVTLPGLSGVSILKINRNDKISLKDVCQLSLKYAPHSDGPYSAQTVITCYIHGCG